MASTEKVSLSLDSGAVLLARRAAELEGMSLSAYVSQLALRHAWDSQRPRRGAREQAAADEAAVEADEHELGERGPHRAAG